jgi:cyclic pyranopterin phosphate synthase
LAEGLGMEAGYLAKRQGEKRAAKGLTHLDEYGRARMVDVSGKEITAREAVASAKVKMQPETLKLIKEGAIKKGDVLAVAQVAGILAAKCTWQTIPMCHPIQITSISINFEFFSESEIKVESVVKTKDRTGVEMEALTAVSVAALTIYDMCKAVDRAMEITDIKLLKKTGGKSGDFVREE